MMNFGKKLKIFRVLRGISGEELAARAGLDRTVVVRHESDMGGDKGPRQKTLEAYARGLSIPQTVLADQEGLAHCLHAVFRPISPYRTIAQEVFGRIVSDLNALLPAFIDDLGLDQVHFYTCELGQIASMTDSGNKFLLIMPLNLARAIHDAFCFDGVENTGSTPISEGLYVLFTLDPVGSLDIPDLPEGLKLDPKAPSTSADIYRPPLLRTKVLLDLIGDHADVHERIKSFFLQGDIETLTVQRPEDWRETLSPEIKEYLARSGSEVNEKGELTKKKY